MSILLFLLVPAVFVYYSAGNRFSGLPTYRLAWLSGVACGVILTAFAFFTEGILKTRSASYIIQYLSFFASCTFIPFGLGPLILFAFFDSPLRDRIERLVPQLFGILTVYFPYLYLSRCAAPDLWSAVLHPALTVSAVFLVDYFIRRYLSRIRLSPSYEGFIVAMLPSIGFLLAIDLTRVLWYFGISFWIYGILGIVLLFLSLLTRLAKYCR